MFEPKTQNKMATGGDQSKGEPDNCQYCGRYLTGWVFKVTGGGDEKPRHYCSKGCVAAADFDAGVTVEKVAVRMVGGGSLKVG